MLVALEMLEALETFVTFVPSVVQIFYNLVNLEDIILTVTMFTVLHLKCLSKGFNEIKSFQL